MPDCGKQDGSLCGFGRSRFDNYAACRNEAVVGAKCGRTQPADPLSTVHLTMDDRSLYLSQSNATNLINDSAIDPHNISAEVLMIIEEVLLAFPPATVSSMCKGIPNQYQNQEQKARHDIRLPTNLSPRDEQGQPDCPC